MKQIFLIVLSIAWLLEVGLVHAQAETETASETESESESESRSESVAESETETETETASEAETESDPPTAAARNPAADRASIHLELATAHFEAGRYDRALLELQTVRELTGRDDLLYNMARCYEAMERREPAIESYTRFLETAPEGDVREDAERRVVALREAAEAARVEGEEDAADDGPGVGTLIGLGVGGVGLLTGAVFGILTLAQDASLSDGCGATHSCTGEDLGDIRVYRSVADLAFTLAAIGGIAGLIGLFLWMGEDDDDATEDEESAFIVPYVVPGEGAGASATLRF